MGASAFTLGFFIALGGWTATKLTKQIDDIIDPPKITKEVNDKIVEPKVEQKEKENDRRN